MGHRAGDPPDLAPEGAVADGVTFPVVHAKPGRVKGLLLPVLVFLMLGRCFAGQLPPKYVRILNEAKEVTLFSINPWKEKAGRDMPVVVGWGNLGGIVFTDPAQVKKVIGVLTAAMEKGGGAVFCFDPRHALRIKDHGHQYDFIICFACYQVYVFRDGRYAATGYLVGSPEPYNRLLRAARVPLPPSNEQLMRERLKKFQRD